MLLKFLPLSGAEARFHLSSGRIRVLISAGYLLTGIFCIFYSYGDGGPYLRMAGILILSLGGLVAWLGALKRYRLIADTPTAALRSAAQGYVELIGTSQATPEAELLYYGKVPPCVWYQATIMEREHGLGGNRTRTNFVQSEDTFTISDGTGECVIDPEHAEVLSAHESLWNQGSTYYKVKYLLPSDRLYAIGDLQTLRAADGILDRKAEVGELLRSWKQDRGSLVQRFDANQDGQVDIQEWQQAVTDAEREVDNLHGEMRLSPGVHVMRAPTDGRPFLLSNRDPDDLVKRYRWWAWVHLCVFISASVWGMTLVF